jgi:hypothetical protein
LRKIRRTVPQFLAKPEFSVGTLSISHSTLAN